MEPSLHTAPADAPANNIVDRFAPAVSQPFLRMARIDRPIGWWLLLLPCWWSSLLASAHVQQAPNYLHIALFLIGAIAMRGAGSTWNDIVDRKLDALVERTRNRPLPSGQISVKAAVIWALLLSVVGLAVLLSFNRYTILLGFLSLLPVAIYPYMKRVTNYPQAVLGLAFAWGALMGWPALTGSLAPAPILLYLGTILWVIGYDTIYAMQDIEDDGIVGIKSTARYFGDRAPNLVSWCYEGTVLLFFFALVMTDAGWPAWIGLAGFATHLLWQYRRIEIENAQRGLMLFRSNRDAGLIFAAGLLVDCFI